MTRIQRSHGCSPDKVLALTNCPSRLTPSCNLTTCTYICYELMVHSHCVLNGKHMMQGDLNVSALPAEVLLNIFAKLDTTVAVTHNSKLLEWSSCEPARKQDCRVQCTPSLQEPGAVHDIPLLQAAQVCKQWRDLIHASAVRHVVAQGIELSPSTSLTQFKSLLTLHLDCCLFSCSTGKRQVQEHKSTTRLKHHSIFRDDSAFALSMSDQQAEAFPFCNFAHISSITLSGCPNLTSATFRSLCHCTSLQAISLSSIHTLVNSDLAQLAILPRLHSLEISNCHNISSAGLSYIQCIPQLRCLRFCGMAVDNDLGMAPTSAIQDLENLDISNTRLLGATHLPALSALTSLTRLSLANSVELSSRALAALAPLTGLRALSLARCRLLAGAAAVCITRMGALTALSFSGCCFLDADALGHIASATALQMLDLSGCVALAGPALARLEPMANLRRLSLARCFFMDDEGVHHCARLPMLAELDLARCDRVVPGATTPLAAARSLQVLNVGDVPPMGTFRSEDWPRLAHLRITRLPHMLEEL